MRTALVLMLLTGTAAADATVDPCACSPNKPGFHRASALTGDWGGERSKLFDRGVKLQAVYAPEIFAAPGLDEDRVVVAGLATVALDLELAELVEEHLGTIHISGLGIHGHGISEQLMDVYGVSNNVAQEDVRLFEAWIEQPLGPLSLRAGMLSADQEFILAEHSTVLMSGTFGIIALMSADLGGPVYPVAALGASATAETPIVTARAAIYDGNQANEHGIPTERPHDELLLGELEAGPVKLGAWHHSELGNGYYGILDRQLERYLGAFARFSVAPDRPVSLYIDAGIRFRNGPRRPRDFISAGVAFARTETGSQTLVEATYQILVRGWLTIQPDAQLIMKANASAAVLATRAVIAF